MKSFGIIAEYNPFHTGHKYLIDTASAFCKADVCISVMSGDFVQRGGYAYFDKWRRAEDAVRNGADLVVELPQIYASSSAGNFARGGISILKLLGCSYVAFGSETGDIKGLKTIADFLSPESKDTAIVEKLRDGLSYPAAREEVVREGLPGFDIDSMKGANDILALEYLIALNKSARDMEPIAIKRSGEGHLESSTKIRKELESSEAEGSRLEVMKDNYFRLIRYSLISRSEYDLEEYDTAAEGLGNKLRKEIRYSHSLEELIDNTKSKRYTYTRISRLLTHILLDIKPEDSKLEIPYIRPLAMNDKGAAYLKERKKELGDNYEDLFVDDVVKTMKYTENENLKRSLSIDIKATDIYNNLQDKDLYSESDYVKHPALIVLR